MREEIGIREEVCEKIKKIEKELESIIFSINNYREKLRLRGINEKEYLNCLSIFFRMLQEKEVLESELLSLRKRL